MIINMTKGCENMNKYRILCDIINKYNEATTIKVAMLIIDSSNDKNISSITYRDMERIINIDKRNIYNHIKRLNKDGFIEIEKQGRRNFYKIV